MSVHRESDLFNYWQRQGAHAGLIALIQSQMGQLVTDHLDLLARNAFLKQPYPFMGVGSASSFAGLSTTTDKMTTDFVDSIWLALNDTQKYNAALPQQYAENPDNTVCLTTAGAIYDLKREVGTGTGGLNFIELHKYAETGQQQLLAGELGSYRGIRFVQNPLAKLWNVGTTASQTTITAAVKPGDGAPDPATTSVEGSRFVGQPGATHSIAVASTTGFNAGDMISIHKTRHDSTTLAAYGYRGVLNGPIYDDPMKQDVEIAAVVDSTHLSIKVPYLMTGQDAKGLETDLGSGVYGYVTKGQTVHTAVFLTPGIYSNAVVCGVAQQPTFYTPPMVDDYMSMFRITYDFWMKFQLWDARAFNVAFLTGQNSLIGNRSFR